MCHQRGHLDERTVPLVVTHLYAAVATYCNILKTIVIKIRRVNAMRIEISRHDISKFRRVGEMQLPTVSIQTARTTNHLLVVERSTSSKEQTIDGTEQRYRSD